LEAVIAVSACFIATKLANPSARGHFTKIRTHEQGESHEWKR
jgi:hypothetical protein